MSYTKFIPYLFLSFFLSFSTSAIAKTNELKHDVFEYFQKFVVHEKGYAFLVDPKSPPTFPVKDLKNGYLTVQSDQIEGSLAFVLFRGGERDLLIKESGNCGPGCVYSYEAITFQSGDFETRQSFAHFYPIASMQAQVRKLLPKKLASAASKKWPEEKDFRFLLPKEGKVTKVYVLTTDSGFYNKQSYFDVGKLIWNKKRFLFSFRKNAVPKDLGVLDLY